jgi:hypothetical protein
VLTIETLLEGVGRKAPRQCPIWPPDLYAPTGALLKRSGAYLRIFEHHQPGGYLKDVAAMGQAWRERIDALKHPTIESLLRARPAEVKVSWEALIGEGALPISGIQSTPKLAEHLIRMALIADEASAVSVIVWLHNDRSWPRSGHGSSYFQSTQVHN